MSGWLKQFKNLHFLWHIFIASAIRAILICYSVYHDEHFTVPYTDIDYKVFTDASRHVLRNGSPYERHTYRYSPLIAIFLIPNLLIHPCFGKVLFCIFDLIVGLLIRVIIKQNVQDYEHFKLSKSKNPKPSFKNLGKNRKYKAKKSIFSRNKSESELIADFGMIVWLYNPLTVAIATRGNSDSIAGLFVLLTLYFMQCKRSYFVAGLLHGFSVHFRLYPIVYSLALFMNLSSLSYYGSKMDKSSKESKLVPKDGTDCRQRKTIFKLGYFWYVWPNLNQLRLIVGCLLSLSILTFAFYALYGYTFLYETYIYHLIRKDVRHNFSLFFYLQYLTADIKNIGLWQKVLITLPQVVLLLVFSVRYGLNKLALNFAILTLTITMVAYNTVMTSQYFVWILVVLPLCLWQIKMSLTSAILLALIWFAAQAAWLVPAYFLEFLGQNTFLYIWIQSVSFFCANIAILGRLMMNFMVPATAKCKSQ